MRARRLQPVPSIAALAPALALWVATIGACAISPPTVIVPDAGSLPQGPFYADFVVLLTENGIAQSCQSSVPTCGADPMPQGGPCAGNPALGVPDTVAYTIGPLGTLTLGFYCNAIYETGVMALGTATPDFKIYSDGMGGGQPTVQVSVDGVDYLSEDLWPHAGAGYMKDPSFRLEVVNLSEVRYVRIAEVAGQGSIHVDAVEALPRNLP